MSAPSGLALFQENGTRKFLGSDSGSTNRPQQTFARAMTAATQNGSRGDLVLVRNFESKKEFTAVVVDEHRVQVRF